LERAQLQSEVEFFAQELSGRYRLVAGKNAFMVQTVDEAKKAAGSKSTVLLLGESGTGKEIFARAIHDWSDRRLKPLIAINCVGLAKELLESELFGHEKGAFTGAHQLKKGKMELADGGTCSWTRSAISPRSFRLSSCDSFRSANSNGWVEPSLSPWT
jgi:Nif-specific regulatory protein